MARGPGSAAGFTVVAKLRDDVTKPIGGINRGIAQATAGIRNMGTRMKTAFTNPVQAFQNFGQSIGNVGRSFAGLGRSIRGFLGPITQIGAVLGGIGLATFTTDLVQTGTELVKFRDQSGLTVEAIQEWRYAAKQAGISAEEFDAGVMQLNKTMRQAAAGDKKALEVMNLLGVSRKDLISGTVTTNDVMERLSNAVADQTTQVGKNTLASAAMGRAGARLIPILNGGAEGFWEMADEARKAGIMTTDVAERAKVFDDTMTTFVQYLKGIGLDVFGALLPAMQGIATGMSDWIKLNKDWLSQEITATVKSIGEGFKALGGFIKTYILPPLRQLTPAWEWLTETFGKGNIILTAFTAVVAPGIIGAIIGIGKAILGLLIGNPIGLIVTAIAAAGYLIWKYWDDIVGAFNWAKEKVEDAIDAILDFLDDLGILAPLEAVVDSVIKLAPMFFDALWQVFTAPWNLIKAVWNALPDDFGKYILDVITGIGSFYVTLWDAFFTMFTDPVRAVEKLWEALPDTFKNFITNIANAIVGSEIFKAVVDIFNLPVKAVEAIWEALPQDFRDFITDIGNAIAGMASWLWEKITAPFMGPINWVKKQLSDIPLLGRLVGGGVGAGEAPAAAPVTADMPAELAMPSDAKKPTRAERRRAERETKAANAAASAAQVQVQKSEAKIDINLANLPAGSTVRERHTGDADVRLNATYSGTPALAGVH